MALLAASSSLSCLSLRCAHASTPAPTGTHLSRVAAASPLCAAAPPVTLPSGRFNVDLGGSALAGALFASLASSDSAMAAQEMMNLAAAADDNRGLGLLLTLLPAVGWVLFNILQPALNQLDRMKSAKGLAVGLGMGAAASLLVCPPHADAAAQEIASLAADNDSRGFLLLTVLVPAIGWVLFNILKPALNQLDRMNSAKGVLGAVGLSSALLLCASQADAAVVQEITSLADGINTASSDARGLLLLGVLAPAVGWVLFNILKPGLSQLDKMKAAKGIFGAVGLSGALLSLTPQADAAVQEVSRLADSMEPAGSDARSLLLLAALVPALGWVLFNILQPALNQFDRMKASKGIAAAVGLGAASALLPLHADALQELATVADNDSRGTLVLFVLIPAIGWVLFNILQPALNQFDKMKAQK